MVICLAWVIGVVVVARLAWLVPPGNLHGLFVGMSTMQSSVVLSRFPSRIWSPGIVIGAFGLNTVAFSPWNRTARLPLQSLFTDSSGVVISSYLSICRLIVGSSFNAISSVADAVIILSSATCALVASSGDTSW